MFGKQDGYTVKPFPRIRGLVVDAGHIGHGKHTVRGLFEVDVTEPRRRIAAHKAESGETLSFTGFVIACLGQAVEMNLHMHAYRDWRNRLILYDEVDAIVNIEVKMDGHRFPMAHIMRAVNRRTFRDLHDEIRAIQANPQISHEMALARRVLLLPALARRLAYRAINRRPSLQKRYLGTVAVTSVGMFGTGGGWGLGLPKHNLAVTIGGIAEKPGVVDGQIVVREYLCLTLNFDHDIVDGAPAARFAQRFKDLIEQGTAFDS